MGAFVFVPWSRAIALSAMTLSIDTWNVIRSATTMLAKDAPASSTVAGDSEMQSNLGHILKPRVLLAK